MRTLLFCFLFSSVVGAVRWRRFLRPSQRANKFSGDLLDARFIGLDDAHAPDNKRESFEFRGALAPVAWCTVPTVDGSTSESVNQIHISPHSQCGMCASRRVKHFRPSDFRPFCLFSQRSLDWPVISIECDHRRPPLSRGISCFPSP